MSVKVSFEFDSPEKAIVMLGRLAGVGAQVEKPASKSAAKGEDKPKRPVGRPPRTEKQMIEEANAQLGLPGVPPVDPASAPAAPAAPAAPPAVAPVATEEDGKKAIEALVGACGVSVAQQLLSDYGVKRFGELPADKYGAFVASANALIQEHSTKAAA